LKTKGAKLDTQGRELLEEDLRSPCTEEIAVFQAFSRIIREAGKKFVVMDTAPTGHTLLLQDATGAYHREVSRQIGGSGLHYTTPMMQLQDTKQTRFRCDTMQSRRFWRPRAANRLSVPIEPKAWVINTSVAAASNRHLRQRTNELRGCASPPPMPNVMPSYRCKEEPVGVNGCWR
jgi:arsenite-transporting ATPase